MPLHKKTHFLKIKPGGFHPMLAIVIKSSTKLRSNLYVTIQKSFNPDVPGISKANLDNTDCFKYSILYSHLMYNKVPTDCLVAEPDKVLVGELNEWVANPLGPGRTSALQIKTRSA